MKITNRLYTYPILSEEKDDYLNSKFEVQMGYIKSVNSIELKFEFYMDNKELEQLIRDGKIVIKQKPYTYEINPKNHIRTSSGVRFVC